MGQVGISLTKVSTKRRRACRKPNCRTGSYKLHRHHRRHEFMFVSSFIRTKYREQTYKDFVARYYKFLPEDVVDICAEHHLEIHVLYDRIIQQDLQLTKKKLRDYSWAEAESLMSKLGRRCGVWLKTETRGQKTGRRTAVKGGFQSAVTDLKKRWNKK